MEPSVTTSLPLDSANALAAAGQLLEAAASAGGHVRFLGGVGVAMRCPSAREAGPLSRRYSDLDAVIAKGTGPTLAKVMIEIGFDPEERFNAVHGHSRMMFNRTSDDVHVDVFVNEFVMCHRLDLGRRLRLNKKTVPLADLLLTKLQVAQLNGKDVSDVAALLLDHDLSADDAEGINLKYITDLLGRDWGWWRTVSENLQALPGHLRSRLPSDVAAETLEPLERLRNAIESAPKSLRWKTRARVGDRLPWRDEPEERG